MKQRPFVPYKYKQLKNNLIMKLTEQPKGRTFLSQEEKNTILRMRLLTYSIKQISEHTGRSRTTVKRIIYGW
jgi:hypothetical protein